jgi:hypothetical protein
VSEKKATSEPATKKEIVNNRTAKNISTADAAGVIASKEKCKELVKSIAE